MRWKWKDKWSSKLNLMDSMSPQAIHINGWNDFDGEI
jgi:hypothetical protein